MKKVTGIVILICVFCFLVLFLVWNNFTIKVSDLSFHDESLPKEADGLVVAHISDIHDSVLMNNLAVKIQAKKPDIILITGDLTGRNTEDRTPVFEFLKKLSPIAPTLYVLGNHEFSILDIDAYMLNIEKTGTMTLRNETFKYKGITWIGIDDRHFWQGKKTPETTEDIIHSFLKETAEKEEYSILLAHRPRLSVYDQTGVSLVFSGHYHGGMWRFPGIPGVFSPDDGFFPKYSAGFYQGDEITMYLSRGIGNSGPSFRLFNRPDLSFITLRK